MTDQPGSPAVPTPTPTPPTAPPPPVAGTTPGTTAAPAAGPGTSRTTTSTTADTAPTADWTDQVTDLIVDSVDKVRARTTGPILEVAKGSVYAVVALILLLPIAIFASAGAVRLLNWALPGTVWVAYAVLSALLLLVGIILWSRRTPRGAS